MNNKNIYPHLDKLAYIKEMYDKGENITSLLKEIDKVNYNSVDAIRIAYDLQAGSYVKSVKVNEAFNTKYTQSLADIIDEFSFSSIAEIGVGEATTLANVLNKIKAENFSVYGFDISWSRIKFAKNYCEEKGVIYPELFTGDLFNIPLMSNSIDIVYTSHSLEPNGGREREALKELYRIANKYIILLEPAYELASEKAKNRMDKLGYIKGLPTVAKELGYNIVEYRLFDYSVNSLNPTGIIIIKKEMQKKEDYSKNPLACPITKTSLNYYKEMNCYYGKKSLLAYPIIGSVPCLLPSNAVVATHINN